MGPFSDHLPLIPVSSPITLVTTRLGLHRTRILTALSLFTRKTAIPFITHCHGRHAKGLSRIRLQRVTRQFRCLARLRSHHRAILTRVSSRKGLAPNLGTTVLTYRRGARLRSLCLPCQPGQHAHTAVTGRGKLRSLTRRVRTDGRSKRQLGLPRITRKFIGTRGNITAIRRTLRKTTSVLTRRITRQTSLHHCIQSRLLGRKRVDTDVGGSRPRNDAGCRVCQTCRTPIHSVTSRGLLTLLQKRQRNILGIDLSLRTSPVLGALTGHAIGAPIPRLHRFCRTLVRSTCGHLVGPSLADRIVTRGGT